MLRRSANRGDFQFHCLVSLMWTAGHNQKPLRNELLPRRERVCIVKHILAEWKTSGEKRKRFNCLDSMEYELTLGDSLFTGCSVRDESDHLQRDFISAGDHNN